MTSRYCGTCGALLTPEALAAGHCLVCDAPTPEPLNLTDEPHQAGGSPDQASRAEPSGRRGGAVWPTPQAPPAPRASSGGFLRALGLGLGAALAAVLIAALLAVFLQRSFNITLAPFSSSDSSANSNSSSQSLSSAQATLTATTTQGRAPTATARSAAATPTSDRRADGDTYPRDPQRPTHEHYPLHLRRRADAIHRPQYRRRVALVERDCERHRLWSQPE